jgi:hypothetical protein
MGHFLRFSIACFGFVALFAPAQANACSPIVDVLYAREMVPGDGATQVPLNAKIRIAYDARVVVMSDLDHPALETSTGEAVATEMSVAGPFKDFTVTPLALLAPNTRYRIMSNFASIPCAFHGRSATFPACSTTMDGGVVQDGGGEPGSLDAGQVDGGSATDASTQALAVIGSFTTGASTDVTAPSPPGNIHHTRWPSSCTGGGCCFEYHGFEARISWEASSDDTGVAYYEVSTAAGAGIQTTLSMDVLFRCGTYMGDIGLAGPYQVVAVDLAGNRSTPATVDLSDVCDRGCGCHLGGPTRGTAAAFVIAGLLLLLAARSRAYRRGHP